MSQLRVQWSPDSSHKIRENFVWIKQNVRIIHTLAWMMIVQISQMCEYARVKLSRPYCVSLQWMKLHRMYCLVCLKQICALLLTNQPCPAHVSLSLPSVRKRLRVISWNVKIWILKAHQTKASCYLDAAHHLMTSPDQTCPVRQISQTYYTCNTLAFYWSDRKEIPLIHE